ncbi:M64 family metallopeptidase [Chitinophaga sedimenti]|uniref:M64 family metallopeptidase n=1 Tax=Chitinophaga sedimenti TaxID=2033606 RepID=UPI0027E1B5EF|nr:M64 family metallopeptidase [Chitinophaga sedimenti]
MAIHEIGHSFGGLADEYWAGAGYAGEKANMTATSNPATVKWKNWVGINNIGVYAYGGSAPASDWYRPHQSCRMQYLGNAFCSVCVEALISKIHSKVNMIDSYTPLSTAFTIMGTSPRPFTIRKLQTTNNSVSVQWFLNNTPLAVTDSITIPYTSFVSGTNTVKAVVTDATGLSKSYLPAAGYTRTISWTVEKMAGLLPFEGFTSLGVNKLKWEKDSINQAAVNYIRNTASTAGYTIGWRCCRPDSGVLWTNTFTHRRRGTGCMLPMQTAK